MNKHDYKQNAYYLIYLIRCMLHNRIPAKEKLDRMDLSCVFAVAQAHSLTAIAAYALESAGIYDKDFEEAKARSIRKVLLHDIERADVFSEFEKAGIWYLPLKGIILKDYYPKIGMRQITDNDILIDSTRQSDIREIMLKCGFRVQSYDKSKHDVYLKDPVCNFQMHITLFEADGKSPLYNYFKDIDKRILKDPDSKFGRHFTDEDFYLYIKSHEYKHFSSGGTGLRNLVDTYLYLKSFNDKLDWSFLDAEFEKLQFADYEKNSRELSLDLFDGKKLSDPEKKLLDYYIFSGTFGNLENSIRNTGSKSRYVLERLFVPAESMEKRYPVFYRHRFFLPFLPFYRVFCGLKNNRKKIVSELKTLIKL